MEGLNLDQAQLERLVELDRKFSREGLTFDDVLLVPAESRVLPNDVSTATRLTRTIVSTDDERIAECAKSLGLDVPFMRPSSLAAHAAPMLPVLQHAIDRLKADGFAADIVVLLQPTSPLRRGEHIDAAVDLLERSGAESVVSVVEVPHQFNPTSVMRIEEGLLKPFLDAPTATSRQDKPRVYARNGPAVLATRVQVIKEGSLYGRQSWPLGLQQPRWALRSTPCCSACPRRRSCAKSPLRSPRAAR